MIRRAAGSGFRIRNPEPLFRALAVAAVIGSSPAQAQSDAVTFAIAIKDGAVARAQRVLRVDQDVQLRLIWSADRALTVHLEGYDISVTVLPERPAEMAFKAFASGRFPVHAHPDDAGTRPGAHAHGRGTLLRLEVHPK